MSPSQAERVISLCARRLAQLERDQIAAKVEHNRTMQDRIRTERKELLSIIGELDASV